MHESYCLSDETEPLYVAIAPPEFLALSLTQY